MSACGGVWPNIGILTLPYVTSYLKNIKDASIVLISTKSNDSIIQITIVLFNSGDFGSGFVAFMAMVLYHDRGKI